MGNEVFEYTRMLTTKIEAPPEEEKKLEVPLSPISE